MMMCRDVAEAMTDADEGALTGSRAVLYRLHLKVCPACQAHHQQVETTKATLAALPKEEPSDQARDKALAAFRKKKKSGV